MASIIKETQSIKEAVTFINAIDVNKFSRLISRILQKLHLKGERTFSEEEEQKLQTALSLDKRALSLMVETAAFILEQAVYHNVKPASLQQQLEAAHMRSDKAEIFSQAWAANGPELVERLKRNIFTPKKLDSVGWQLNLQMAQSSQASLKSPSAVLQLGLTSEDCEAAGVQAWRGVARCCPPPQTLRTACTQSRALCQLTSLSTGANGPQLISLKHIVPFASLLAEVTPGCGDNKPANL